MSPSKSMMPVISIDFDHQIVASLAEEIATEDPSEIKSHVINILRSYILKRRRKKEKEVWALSQKRAPLDAFLPKGADPFTAIGEESLKKTNHLCFETINRRMNRKGRSRSYLTDL